MSGKRSGKPSSSDEVIERKRSRRIVDEDEDGEEPIPPSQSQEPMNWAVVPARQSTSIKPSFGLKMSQSSCSLGGEKEPEVGIIEYLHMENFMCHSKLEINFGHHVNFIIGNNGSGKSAVLTALMVGLGGKASTTDRGCSVKAFIKNGKKCAKTTIRLRNCGHKAYKPETYGDAIIVERRISADGGGGYRLKNGKSVVVSTKRDELDTILERFNIQVENPISILSQEASRTFLMSRNPKDQYKFFMNATQLEQIKQDYFLAQEKIEGSEQNLKDKEKLIEGLQRTVDEWRRRFEALTIVDRLKERLSVRKKEMACALVRDRQRAAESAEQELISEESRTQKFVDKIEECEVKVKDKEEEHQKIAEELKQLADTAAQLQGQHGQLKDSLTAERAQHRKCQEEMRKLENEIKSLERDKNQITTRIEELSRNGNEEYQTALRERNRRMEVVNERIETLKRDETSAEQQCAQCREENAQLRNKKDTLDQEERNNRGIERKLTDSIKQLTAARSNKLRVYGDFMPALVQRINDAVARKQFNEPPRGPLGSLITVKDSQWNLALESCLGAGLLRSFAVTNFHDSKVLEQIFKSVCPSNFLPNIICGKFQHTPYRVPANCNPYPTVLEMLNIEDPVVNNCLIDQRGIEFILLIKNSQEALNYAGTQADHRYNEIFSTVGDQIYSRPTTRFYASNIKNTRFLAADVESNIREFESQLGGVRDRLKHVDVERRGLMEELNQRNSELRRAEESVRKISQALNKANWELKELANTEVPAPVDISMLEEEVLLIENNMAGVAKRRDESAEKTGAQLEKMLAAEIKFKDIDKQIRDATRAIDPYRESLSNCMAELKKANDHKKHYQAKLKEHQSSISEIRKRYEKLNKEYEEDKAKVLEHFQEIGETRRKAVEIEAEIKSLRTQIQDKEKTQGNADEIAQTYKNKLESFKKAEKELKEVKRLIEQLSSSIQERQKFFKKIRESMAFRVKVCFMHNLSVRGFKGHIDISHKKQILEPFINPSGSDGRAVLPVSGGDDDDEEVEGGGRGRGWGKRGGGEEGRSSKTLSGGERSYSTCCLIMALWEAMDIPFRCLDEFDVFMDMINRRMTTDMILQTAAEKKNSQFIILSPFHLCEMKISTDLDVTIFQMKPPERSSQAPGGPPPS